MLTLSQAAKYLVIHPKTLQRMDRKGELKAYRTDTNRRLYPIQRLRSFRKRRYEDSLKTVIREVTLIIRRHYGRVESQQALESIQQL